MERLAAALSDRYRIERELGQGGMATVYLAHDLRHDRDVAIKVLHADLGAALGPDRFLSEIKTTAKLQHPHILPLLDSGSADGLLYYVMPLVTGETLRTRLERERQLPIDTAVLIAREVADALGYAHSLGIIHRDIKPENVLLQGGHALVADFGIALAVQHAGGARMTQTGLSLGTPQYMSPEQAMGERAIDARSDIYALGAVTYEMLVGEAPFTGPGVQAIVARLITETPRSLAAQRKAVPEHVEEAVLRALEKLPADRFATASEFTAALGGGAMPATSLRRAARTGGRQSTAAWAGDARTRLLMAALLVVFIVLAIMMRGKRSVISANEAMPPIQGRLFMAPDEQIVGSASDAAANSARPSRTAFTFSPDGAAVVYAGSRNGVRQLFLRSLAAETSTAIAGTEGAESPFFAPDGRSIGYWAGGKLMRVPRAGGQPTEITSSARIAGATWSDDDRLVFGAGPAGLIMLSPSGAFAPDTIATGAFLPQWLPGGKVLMITSRSPRSTSGFRIELLTPPSRTRLTLVDDGSDARYVATGHVVFARNGVMLAAPFDLHTLKLTGTPAVVLPDVMVAGNGSNVSAQTGAMQVAISPIGHLLYLAGGPTPDRSRQIVSIDRAGRSAPLTDAGNRPFFALRLSPDQRRLAATLVGMKPALYTYDLGRNDGQVITEPGRQLWPLWSRDGMEVVRSGLEGDSATLITGPADGSRKAKPLVAGKIIGGSGAAWSVDGAELLVQRGTGQPIEMVTLADGTRRQVEGLPDSASYLDLSPDGRWIIYAAPEAGSENFQVFAQPWPALDRKWKVSVAGGVAPRWTRNGREIVYPRTVGTDSLDQSIFEMMAVDVAASGDFSAGQPRPLFRAAFGMTSPLRSYDVTADGSRFFVVSSLRSQSPPGQLHIMFNWVTTLRQLEAEQTRTTP